MQVHAHSGDTNASVLQPHQVLIAHEDATLHSIQQLDLVCMYVKQQPSVLLVLECVIDRHQSCNSRAVLTGGRIQLHPWVLDVCGHSENTLITLEKVHKTAKVCSWALTLSLQTKFPLVATSSSDSVSVEAGDSRIALLPESVRQRQIDLEAVAQRQLRRLRAPQERQLVPVTLLGDVYVFKIQNVKEITEKDVQVFVKGWSNATEAEENIANHLATLSVEERDSGRTFEKDLDARLWTTGLAGYTRFVQDVLLNLALVLKRGQNSLENGQEMEQIGSHGLLISGVNGVGKSLALVTLQRELIRDNISTWRIDGLSLLMGAEGPAFPTAYEYLTHELEQHFPDFDSQACRGVVLIDDLDVLFQSADGQIADGSDAQPPPLGSALLRLIDELSSRNSRLVIVGTTMSADANIPAAAKRIGRFGKVLDLVVPTEQSRREILSRYLTGLPLCTADNAEDLSSRLAALTGGYVAKDLVRICRNAAAQAHSKAVKPSKSFVGWVDLLHAQQQVKPSQLRELNVASPGAPVEGKLAFAGYSAVQKQLFDFVSWKFHPTAAMNRLGISNASGILLSGPSGCGKTLLVQTLAARAQVNFVSVKSSELLSKYFGDSEKAVRQLFARARAASPCLLFFDEFDSIAHKRSFGEGDGGSSGGGVYARVLSTFLNEMDGVGSQRVSSSFVSHGKGSSAADSGGILVVAATNRREALDAALVRPGRIDKTVELGFPTQEDIQVRTACDSNVIQLLAD
ncbi:hypothetical protein DVH05_020342 [Phytophthora capsici]|nr:hypothetical protein DVH05_020342 [Phytophthora capsici]